MKLDRTLVTHVSEQTERDLLALLEYERLRGDAHLTVSSLLNSIVEGWISDHRQQYQALERIFGENGENGANNG